MPFNPTTEQQAYMLSNAMQTPEGRRFIAQRMFEPIRQERDYVSIGRQGFIIDPIGQGELPYYDVDVKTRAIILSKRGEVPQERVNIQRVMLDFFPLVSYALIPIQDTKLRRFDVLDRVQTKARADLAEEEDRIIFGNPSAVPDTVTTYGGQNVDAMNGVSVYRAATPSSASEDINGTTYGPSGAVWDDAFGHQPNTVYRSENGLTKELLNAATAEIFAHDLVPEAIILNPRDYADLRLWGRDEMDPETQREVLETGRMGRIWEQEIFISKICPRGTGYVRAADSYLGVMPILIDLDVMDAPDFRGLNYGFLFYEYISVAILNAWGVARMEINR
jgi:hypothetical protein